MKYPLHTISINCWLKTSFLNFIFFIVFLFLFNFVFFFFLLLVIIYFFIITILFNLDVMFSCIFDILRNIIFSSLLELLFGFLNSLDFDFLVNFLYFLCINIILSDFGFFNSVLVHFLIWSVIRREVEVWDDSSLPIHDHNLSYCQYIWLTSLEG